MTETTTEQWNLWYKRTHDELTRTIAELKTTTNFVDQVLTVATEEGINPKVATIPANTMMQFLSAIMRNQNALYAYSNHALDFEDLLWKKFDSVTQKIDNRDKEITDTFELLLAWKKEFNETMEQAKAYFSGMAGKIKPKDD